MRRGRVSGSRCSGDAPAGPGDGQGASAEVVLNVGCGSAYRPGLLNIDISASSAVDLLADACHLPLRAGSVDSIEADQLLEHFDTAHARLVLSEFHRVLRPEGALTIETPDIQRSVKRFVSAEPGRQGAELQWIYGLDSPGLQHKSGFTRESLTHMLDESSFQVVRFDKPRTHRYEPGIRALCRRRKPASRQWTAVSRALSGLTVDGAFNDSLVLVPLQEELIRMCRLSRGDDDDLLSRACVLNPEVALAIEPGLSDGGAPAEGGRTKAMERLIEARFHERAFTLWKKSARRGGGRKEFEQFTERLAEDVRACVLHGNGSTDNLGYVLSLDPTPIRLMEHRLAMIEGQKALSRGAKMYASGRPDRASGSFKEALAIDPGDFCAAMNLARTLANSAGRTDDACQAYDRAVESAPAHLKGAARREASEYRDTSRSPNTPFVIQ